MPSHHKDIIAARTLWGLPYMTSTRFLVFFDPLPSLSAKPILFVHLIGAKLCVDFIYGSPFLDLIGQRKQSSSPLSLAIFSPVKLTAKALALLGPAGKKRQVTVPNGRRHYRRRRGNASCRQKKGTRAVH